MSEVKLCAYRQKHDAELGNLTVQESRKQGASRQIKIAFLRLPSTSLTPGMPIVFLMGGPGIPGTLMTRVPVYYRLFEQLRAIADVIIPDQRGVGMSTPNLDCPDKSSFPPDAWESRDKVVRAAASEWQPAPRCSDSKASIRPRTRPLRVPTI